MRTRADVQVTELSVKSYKLGEWKLHFWRSSRVKALTGNVVTYTDSVIIMTYYVIITIDDVINI